MLNNDAMNRMTETEKRARDRVDATPALVEYADICLYDDWMSDEEHQRYLVETPVEEIVSWADSIRRNQKEERVTCDRCGIDCSETGRTRVHDERGLVCSDCAIVIDNEIKVARYQKIWGNNALQED